MRHDVHVCHTDTRATVRLRRTGDTPVLFAMTGALGIDTDVAHAALFGVSTKTISRLRANDAAHHFGGHPEVQIGEKFMANAVTALSRHADTLRRHGFTPSLDELFEVVPAPAMAEAA
ncbi:hypothetical protein AB0J14_04305 [Micromonospora arborensis]|uniref:hypothetical protein n=1 Tax=Micromonospora arborensis TaxID=2116518 RepID=UPI0033DBCFD5